MTLSRSRIALLLLAAATLVNLGCGDPTKDLLDRQAANWQEIADVLKSVKDSASMDQAEDRIMKRGAEYRRTNKEFRSLSLKERQRLGEFASQANTMAASLKTMADESQRIHGLPGGPEFLERIRELGGTP